MKTWRIIKLHYHKKANGFIFLREISLKIVGIEFPATGRRDYFTTTQSIATNAGDGGD